jgi:hypothetical protein
MRRNIWGPLYLALIPLYALGFSRLPSGSFHDVNIKFERGLKRDARTIAQELFQDSAALQQRNKNWAFGAYVNGVPYNLTYEHPLQVVDVTSDGATLVAHVRTEAVKWRRPPKRRPPVAVGAILDAKLILDLPNIRGDGAQGLDVSRVAGPTATFPAYLVTSKTGSLASIGLRITRREYDAINLFTDRIPASHSTLVHVRHFAAASSGDPLRASDTFWTMLYLSMVAITTLGFGDVTPVSTTARLLVGSEAVLGVVMAGLFLNHIARGGQRRA